MNLSEFDYNLPEERIAKYPPIERGTTRLLVLDRESREIQHKRYVNVVDYIKPGDVVVLNYTKVQNVRTFPKVERSNRQVQLMFLENIQYHEAQLSDEETKQKSYEYWYALIGRAKHVKIGDTLIFDGGERVEVIDRKTGEEGFIVRLSLSKSTEIFNKYGHVPLPPYMKREDNEDDKVRYNTVFAKQLGSVAAPTASLNLTDELLQKIREKGARIVYVELKISWGTFAPVKTEQIEDFKIHHEEIIISKKVAEQINETIKNGKDVWAFGTTATRLLESVAELEEETGKYLVKEYEGDTNIFIYPGYTWKIVNHMITNFHTPKSSLLMLVSSFASHEMIFRAYREAVENKYNFLSYGDSMLIY
jgi:S-adenosylmethionine:tRNA ribosyltransferase-isomerase